MHRESVYITVSLKSTCFWGLNQQSQPVTLSSDLPRHLPVIHWLSNNPEHAVTCLAIYLLSTDYPVTLSTDLPRHLPVIHYPITLSSDLPRHLSVIHRLRNLLHSVLTLHFIHRGIFWTVVFWSGYVPDSWLNGVHTCAETARSFTWHQPCNNHKGWRWGYELDTDPLIVSPGLCFRLIHASSEIKLT